jgi:hypothetical protein
MCVDSSGGLGMRVVYVPVNDIGLLVVIAILDTLLQSQSGLGLYVSG